MQEPEVSGRPTKVARSEIPPSEIAPPEIAEGPPDPATLTPGQRARRERIVMTALKLLEEGEYELVLEIVDQGSGRRLEAHERFTVAKGPR